MTPPHVSRPLRDWEGPALSLLDQAAVVMATGNGGIHLDSDRHPVFFFSYWCIRGAPARPNTDPLQENAFGERIPGLNLAKHTCNLGLTLCDPTICDTTCPPTSLTSSIKSPIKSLYISYKSTFGDSLSFVPPPVLWHLKLSTVTVTAPTYLVF